MRAILLLSCAATCAVGSLGAQARPTPAEWDGTIVIEHRFVYDQPDERTRDSDGLGYTVHYNRSSDEYRKVVFTLRGGRVSAWVSGEDQKRYANTSFRWGCGDDDTPRPYASTLLEERGNIRTAKGAAPVRIVQAADGSYRIEATSPPEQHQYPYMRHRNQQYRVVIPGDPPLDCADPERSELGAPYEKELHGMLRAVLTGQASPQAQELVGWTGSSRGLGPRAAQRKAVMSAEEAYPLLQVDELDVAPLVPAPDKAPAAGPPVDVEFGPDQLPRIVLRGANQGGSGPPPPGMEQPVSQGVWWRATWHLTRRRDCRTVQEAVDALKAMRDRQIAAAEATESDRAQLTGDGEEVVAERGRLDARAKALREFAESLALDIAVEESALAGCRR